MQIYKTLENIDFQAAQELFYNKEVLTAEEAQLVQDFMPTAAKEYLFHNTWNNTWVNLNVYSEAEKEKRDLEKEMGL
jgi:hypothetical protein